MRDEWMLRGEVPMTKSEVRAISISKLELDFYSGKDIVLYDVGAGTGSVSIEVALGGKCKKIYAIERKKEGVELIRTNMERWGVSSAITIIEGEAPEVFSQLEKPTHAFIGGSGGKTKEILDLLFQWNPKIRIVMNLVTLESIALLNAVAKERNLAVEMVMVAITKVQEVGKYHMLHGQNPIYIASFGGEESIVFDRTE